MKAVLSLELIGDDMYAFQRARARGRVDRILSTDDEISIAVKAPPGSRTWVARLTPSREAPGFARSFLDPSTLDYSHANSIGSRGVYAYFILDDGMYEVNARESWRHTRRYYARVEAGTVTEIRRREVYQWLSKIT